MQTSLTLTIRRKGTQKIQLSQLLLSNRCLFRKNLLNYNSYTFDEIGKSLQLQATIKPDGASEKGVIWSSSNEDVCMVSSTGFIVAVGNGTADITATTVEGGFTATCKVKVEDLTPVSSIDSDALGYTVYDLQGRECRRLQKGINIIRFSDGSTKKVLNK